MSCCEFTSFSPDNERVEDCAYVVTSGEFIPDGAVVVLSKETTVDGELLRVVNIINQGNRLVFVAIFNDDGKMSWLPVTDYDLFHMGLKNGLNRLSKQVADNVNGDVTASYVSPDKWEEYVQDVLIGGIVQEACETIGDVVPEEQSVMGACFSLEVALSNYMASIEESRQRIYDIAPRVKAYRELMGVEDE